jgi:NADPH2:quinone reductase
MADTGLQLRSTVKEDNTLELNLVDEPIPQPGRDEVLVRIEATPLNPSDLALLFGPADLSTARVTGTPDRTIVTAAIPPEMMKMVVARVGQSLPVGNEGAGTVIAAGESDAAQALVGKRVGIIGGEMYSQYRCVNAFMCLPLEEGTTAAEGASCFVNPLTALGMVETMRLENHKALAHTAAASNLGQMLNRICLAEDVPLVNVVRRAEQKQLLEQQHAQCVVDSSTDSFLGDLTDALAQTGATLAFDATGGGKLAGQLLACMEAAASRNAKTFSRYGSDVHKQVYIYGGLDRSPTVLNRAFGMAWGLGGWLLPPFLARIGPQAAQRLRERVAAEIKTTFASQYSREVGLAEVLTLEAIAEYGRQATGHKYLINPQK